MARIRTIKPEFPQSESMGRISRDARLLFILLWTLADDSGRLRGNSRMLASLLFPYDDDVPGLIEGWLGELEGENCIVRYFAGDGSNYVAICNWLDHQKIDKPSDSKLPDPDSCSPRESSRTLANPRERSLLDQGPRTKDQGPGSRTKDQLMSAKRGRDFDSKFEEFWEAFPKRRRTKKDEAYRKWKLCTKKVEADWLVRRAAEYAQSPQGQGDYAVMPTVWLGSGMYKDEPEAWGCGDSESRVASDEDLAGWSPGQ